MDERRVVFFLKKPNVHWKFVEVNRLRMGKMTEVRLRKLGPIPFLECHLKAKYGNSVNPKSSKEKQLFCETRSTACSEAFRNSPYDAWCMSASFLVDAIYSNICRFLS